MTCRAFALRRPRSHEMFTPAVSAVKMHVSLVAYMHLTRIREVATDPLESKARQLTSGLEAQYAAPAMRLWAG